MKDVITKIQSYVEDINAHVEDLESRGPVSKYTLPDEGIRGRCFLFSLLLPNFESNFKHVPIEFLNT